jgi:hypothetical protein
MEKEKALKLINQLAEINKDFSKICDEKYYLGDEFSEILRRHEIYSNGEVLGKILKYFVATFKNISSNSVLLWKDNTDSRESITLGKYGFGIREYRQARPVEVLDDYQALMRHKDIVINKLEQKRKWNKADEFKVFADIDINDFYKALSMTIPLKTPVNIIIDEDSDIETVQADKIRIVIKRSNDIDLALLTDNSIISIIC